MNGARSVSPFVPLFNGKDLTGWKANEHPESWHVEDGIIVGRGPRSHLFYMAEEFDDFEFKADVKINRGGNSGMYFRARIEPAWPKGYKAQVNNSARDPKRTGSLYYFVDVAEQLIPDDTWWNQHVVAQGNHIVIKINSKTVVDYTDEKNTYARGYLALQQHDPDTIVQYKNLMVRKLSPSN